MTRNMFVVLYGKSVGVGGKKKKQSTALLANTELIGKEGERDGR